VGLPGKSRGDETLLGGHQGTGSYAPEAHAPALEETTSRQGLRPREGVLDRKQVTHKLANGDEVSVVQQDLDELFPPTLGEVR
jgi:hypothetical protein